MRKYPVLLQKQIDCYGEDSVEWADVARDRVFPLYAANLARMSVAHGAARAAYCVLLDTLGCRYPIEPQPSLVIYVGIGCGAGWATTYDGRPAILLGLEKVAECGWHEAPLVSSVLAHEYGHLYHESHRPPHGPHTVSPQALTLFSEGLAQRFDHLAAGTDSWALCSHLNDSSWLEWCERNRPMLAGEYLELIRTNKPSKVFFGDWLQGHGRKQVGYYLGHEFVKWLEREMTIEQVAELEDVDARVCRFLQECESGTV